MKKNLKPTELQMQQHKFRNAPLKDKLLLAAQAVISRPDIKNRNIRRTLDMSARQFKKMMKRMRLVELQEGGSK